jgi:hypothetical protein
MFFGLILQIRQSLIESELGIYKVRPV